MGKDSNFNPNLGAPTLTERGFSNRNENEDENRNREKKISAIRVKDTYVPSLPPEAPVHLY